MIRLNLFMIWFLHFLSLLSVICRYYRQNSSSRIIVVLAYTVSTVFLFFSHSVFVFLPQCFLNETLKLKMKHKSRMFQPSKTLIINRLKHKSET